MAVTEELARGRRLDRIVLVVGKSGRLGEVLKAAAADSGAVVRS
jgi:hypothetical protein